VHFTGQRSDIAEILKASNIFVFPSRSDGQGLALVEAMASGLPCLAAATGGIPDVITDGVNGVLFERENVVDLAEKLSRLVEDEQVRLRLSAGAGEAANRYTIDAYVQTVFECYRLLLEPRSRLVPCS
jgi:glycosyltransferase involved in cell wall biosynthesis